MEWDHVMEHVMEWNMVWIMGTWYGFNGSWNGTGYGASPNGKKYLGLWYGHQWQDDVPAMINKSHSSIGRALSNQRCEFESHCGYMNMVWTLRAMGRIGSQHQSVLRGYNLNHCTNSIGKMDEV